MSQGMLNRSIRSACTGKVCSRPRFENESLELRYAAERRARLLPMIKLCSIVYLIVGSAWWLFPRDGMAFEVWLFFRLNSSISNIGCAISVFFLHRSRAAWKHYDFLALFWGCHFITYQGFTRQSTEILLGLEVTAPVHDEGLAILFCIAWITGFFCYAEVDLGYFLVLVHIGPLVWIFYGVWFGVATRPGLFMKLSLMYYLISLLVLVQATRAERARRQMLHMQVSLEGQAQMQRALAVAERTTMLNKVFSAEQQALHAFMAAVFDIMGQLEWRTIEADSEPTLCFVNESNPALDALLKTSTSGMPLEVVLGPPPDPRAPGRVKYTRERQRLWSYAQMEATRPSEETGESTGHQSSQVPARKIAITCSDSSGRQFEAELLIGPGRSGRALFGMLLVNTGQHDLAARYESKDRSSSFGQMETCSDATSPASSNASSEAAALLMLDCAQSQKGEVAVWVDIWNPRLPILKCTVAFTCLSGPSSSGAYFIDWVEEPEAFYRWVQLQMNKLMSTDIVSKDDSAFRLRLRPPGAAGSMLQFQAVCHLEVVPFESVEPSLSMDESVSNEMMAKLCLHNVTHCRRKKNRIGGGRRSPRSRSLHTGIVQTSPVSPVRFSNSKIWLDVHSARFRILDYTLSYATRLGAGALGMNFLDWVVEEERFQEWILSHHQAPLDAGIPHRLSQVILRDPRGKSNVMVTDCMIHVQTKWPETRESQSVTYACIEIRLPKHADGAPKQPLEKNGTRSEKESPTNMSL